MADWVSVLRENLLGYTVGLVFTHALFVLHHAALQVELLLVQHPQQVAHAVTFGEQDIIQHGRRHVFEIIRAVVVGGAVQVGRASLFHGLDVGVIEVVAPAEHQVFEEVGKPGLAQLLVLRADVVPGVDSHDRSLVVFMHQYGQPVAQDKLGVGNVGNGDIHARCRRLRLLRRGRLRLCRCRDQVASDQSHDSEKNSGTQ